MKSLFHFLAIATFAGVALSANSCSKNNVEPSNRAELPDIVDEQSAMENFSVSLSQALYSYQEVRDFMKTEALKRFDNDDEVFYPFVKNVEVGNLGTLREILIRELGGEEKMEQIERELPTLTILVSDASWFDPEGFCLTRWDTSDPCVAVTYRERDGICRRLFGDGYLLGEIEAGTIPGGPVLIVKNSERLVASPSTKSGALEYSFIFDEYDASKNPVETKGRYSWVYLNEAQPSDDDSVSGDLLNNINPDIITAFNLFKDKPYACHNDYIFYGMTSDTSRGRLRTDVKNKIFRIKLMAGAFPRVFDDSLRNDRNYQDTWNIRDGGRGYSVEPSKEAVYAKLWGDGSLEIIFYILTGDQNGVATLPISVSARQLFAVKDNVVMREEWKATVFVWSIDWHYTFGDFGQAKKRNGSTLKEKWYYLPYPIEIPSWDLLNLSFYNLKAEEVDTGTSVTTETTVTTKHGSSNTNKIGLDSSVIPGFPIKLELGWSSSDEETRTDHQTITYTEGSDLLFEGPVSYSDRVITSKAGAKYTLKTIGAGDFIISILPFRD